MLADRGPFVKKARWFFGGFCCCFSLLTPASYFGVSGRKGVLRARRQVVRKKDLYTEYIEIASLRCNSDWLLSPCKAREFSRQCMAVQICFAAGRLKISLESWRSPAIYVSWNR